MDLADDPAELPATGPGASADDMMAHYMEYMWPALFIRASHPVFAGGSLAPTMDVVGIDGAEEWGSAALMRYRSRRDLWEISSDPSFLDRHDYKLAALEKTIAVPVAPQLFLGDPRLILLLVLVSGLSLLNNFVLRHRSGHPGAVGLAGTDRGDRRRDGDCAHHVGLHRRVRGGRGSHDHRGTHCLSRSWSRCVSASPHRAMMIVAAIMVHGGERK